MADGFLIEAGVDRYLLEDGSGIYLQDFVVPAVITYVSAASGSWSSSPKTTGSYSPTTGKALIAVAVETSGAPGGDDITVSGWGYNWVQIQVQTFGGGDRALYLLRGTHVGTPTTGSLTITYGGSGTVSSMQWLVHEVSMGHDTSFVGTPVTGTDTNNSIGATIFDTTANLGDPTFAVVVTGSSGAITPAAGWDELGDAANIDGTLILRMESAWDADKDINPSHSWTGTSDCAIIALTVKGNGTDIAALGGMTLTASVGSSASLLRRVGVVRALSQAASAVSPLRLVQRALSASQASSPAVVRQPRLPRSATQANSATLTPSRLYSRAITATATAVASLARRVGLPRALSQGLTPTVRSALSLIRSASQASTATMTRARPLQLVATAVTAGASLIRRIGLVRAGTQASTSTVTRRVGAIKSVTQAGSATQTKLLPRLLSASQASSATLAAGRAYLRALTATAVTQAASVIRRVGAVKSASQAAVGVGRNRLIGNFDFESGIGGWSTSTDATLTSDATTAGEGSKSLKVTKAAASFPSARFIATFPGVTGAATLRIWVKATLAIPFYLWVDDGAFGMNPTFDVTTSWQLYEFPVTGTGADITKVEVGFNDSLPAAGEAYWVDGIELSQGSSLLRRVGLTRSPTQPGSASVVRRLAATKSATQASSATASRLLPRLLAASSSQVASIARRAGVIRNASSSAGSSITRLLGLPKSSTQASSATLPKQPRLLRSASQASSATLQRRLGPVLSATASTVATIRRHLTLTKLSSSTTVATLVAGRQYVRQLTATVSQAATMTRVTVLQYFLTLTASVPGTATLRRALSRSLTAAQVASPSIVRQPRRSLLASANAAAQVNRRVIWIKTASQAASAAVIRRVSRTSAASQSSTATTTRTQALTRLLSAAQAGSATLSRAALRLRTLSATQSADATARRGLARTLNAPVVLSVTVRRALAKKLQATISILARIIRSGEDLAPPRLAARIAERRMKNSPGLTPRDPASAAIMKKTKSNPVED